MTEISLIQPDDWHCHVRDGDTMRQVLPFTARQFSRAIIMPNLKPPVTTVAAALAYRKRILAALPPGSEFNPLMTLYLTDKTTPDDIEAATQNDHIHAVKYYPSGATTHSDAGITRIENTFDTLAAMEEHDMPLLVHGEVTDDAVDIFDREWVFIDRILDPLLKRFPKLRVVLEHITTSQAVDYVLLNDHHLAATITPQHLLLNRNAMLVGGIQPHHYCLPVLKREVHRQALLKAATSGSPRFFLGTDSAPHAQSAKESAYGCAGIFSAHAAIELYATVFDQQGAIDKLEGFASFYGADFYGLPRNSKRVTLKKHGWNVPHSIHLANELLIPFYSGQLLDWQMVL